MTAQLALTLEPARSRATDRASSHAAAADQDRPYAVRIRRTKRGRHGFAPVDPVERFLSRLGEGSRDSCWKWIGRPGKNGYTKIGVFVNGRWIEEYAHRFSYELFVGPIPDGKQVCHTCDNRECPNPAHLFLGDDQDNRSDMARKFRGQRSRRGLPYGVATTPAGRFDARFRFRRERYYCGTFDSTEEAHAAVIAAMKDVFSKAGLSLVLPGDQ